MFLRTRDSGKSDEELLHLYQTTHQLDYLSQLFLRYTSLIYGVCLKYLKDRDEAKDAVMQIHEKLVESLLKLQIGTFRSWLYVNARNHCLMQLRSAKSRPPQETSTFLMESESVMHPDGENQALEHDLTRLERCIEKLVDAQQVCVRLFFLKERCYRDIVTETGFDLNQVKSYIQNGKRNLKICMESNA